MGRIETFAGVRLDSLLRSISYKSDTYRSVAGTVATVDTAGEIERRVTATRVALMGDYAHAFRKKKDRRQVFMLIEGDDFAWVVQVGAKQLGAAQRFAASVNTASKQAERDKEKAEASTSTPRPAQPQSTASSVSTHRPRDRKAKRRRKRQQDLKDLGSDYSRSA